ILRLLTTVLLAIVAVGTFGSGVCSAEVNLKDFTSKYEKAVVFITAYNEKGSKIWVGSGFFVNADGDFITNRHVVEGAVSATVETVTGEKYSLKKVIAFKPDLDLAMASIENTKGPMPFLEVAEKMPEKGERVVVFGNPMGVKFTVSEGIVSGIQTFPNAEFPQFPYKGMFVQFTAAISGGSSGGPVLNEQGQVVGVSTWGFKPQISQNMNFAVPATEVRGLMASRQEPAAEPKPATTAFAEKKRVALLIMYGSKLLDEVKDTGRREEITTMVEEAISAKFRPNKFIVKGNKDVQPFFEAYWKMNGGFQKPPVMDDVDKASLLGFAENQKYDYVVFAGVDIVQSKRVNYGTYTGAAAEVEVDLRVLNTERRDYAYAAILEGRGSEERGRRFIWQSVSIVKPIQDALDYALRHFKRGFSTEQLL
ncbi:MAG TPA: serine protease, partial [Negativicutes bacterium]|nr:serine protease [Negativicutes bacterium]